MMKTIYKKNVKAQNVPRFNANAEPIPNAALLPGEQMGANPLRAAGSLLAGLAGHAGRGGDHHPAGPALPDASRGQLVEPGPAVPDRRRPSLRGQPTGYIYASTF